jgi:hypothetical protein
MESHRVAAWFAAGSAAWATSYALNLPDDMRMFEADVVAAAKSSATDKVRDVWDGFGDSPDETTANPEPDWQKKSKIALGFEPPFALMPHDTWRDATRTVGLGAVSLVAGTYWMAARPRRRS